MSSIHTRTATLAELGSVATLFNAYRQFYGQPADLALATRFIQDRLQGNQSVILLALSESQQTLGFCQLYSTFCSVEASPIYSLYDLYVIPEARRSGAGKALLQAAERHASESGMVRLDLTTAKTNASAQSLYESQGWIKDEVFYAYSKHVEA